MNSLVKVAGRRGRAIAQRLRVLSPPSLGAPWGNSSDLVLVVENASTHVAYALDTGVTLDSLLPTGSLVSGATLNTSLSGNQQGGSVRHRHCSRSWLRNPAAGDVWTLEGGQYNGAGSQKRGPTPTRSRLERPRLSSHRPTARRPMPMSRPRC